MSLVQYIKEMQFSSVSREEETTDKGNSVILSEIVFKVKNQLVENDEIRRLAPQAAKRRVIETAMNLIERIIEDEYKGFVFDFSDKSSIYEMLIQNMFGFGVIEPYLKNKDITEIMVNGTDNIFIEKEGVISRALAKTGEPLAFSSVEELKSVIQKIVAPINRKVDESDPIVDARLPDGSRVNIALSPVSLDGISMTIRKFPEKPYTMDQLIEFGTINENAAELLKRMVRARFNIIVSGGTGSGKTTFLNALSSFIPAQSRIITIEDSAELKFNQIQNKVRLETRPPNLEGKGEITMRTLVRSALRMRPDRIIVGEVRGGEALDMLQAMNTGHEGSLTTGHANSALDMLLRLETMVLMAGLNLPLYAIRQQVASAIELIIHLGKIIDGKRKVLNITELLGLENGEYKTQELFTYQEQEETKESACSGGTGKLVYSGNGIQNIFKFQAAGISDYTDYLK